MLLEFRCSNHKSIKEKVSFSMIAGSDNTSEEFLKEYSNFRVLSSAVIYGANGSGKSNFLEALMFLKQLVGNSITHQPGHGILQRPHKLSAPTTPSEYEIQFIKNGIRYAYGFSLKESLVYQEYLYYFPKGRQVKIFEREENDVKPGDRYKGAFELAMNALKENRLLLSCAANYSNVEEVEEAFKFIDADLIFYDTNANDWLKYTLTKLQDDEDIKKKFLDILYDLNTGITDVKSSVEKVTVNELPPEIQMPDAIRQLIGKQEGTKIQAKVFYEDFDVDLIQEESRGIKKLFEVLGPILDILENGKVLLCDEFECGLHEKVVEKIVQIFQRAQTDNFAQLIFSTHDTSLLDQNLFRRDQIWFTQLTKRRTTDLYSLAEIRNVRKTENISKGYISGKYGAIPVMNDTFVQAVEKMSE